jgi:hypothetical protein
LAHPGFRGDAGLFNALFFGLIAWVIFAFHVGKCLNLWEATRIGGCPMTTIDLASCLAAIPDRRRAERKIYSQVGVILFSIIAMLSGARWPCCTEVSKGATAPSWNRLRDA